MHVTGLRDYVSDPAYASVTGLLLYGKDVRSQQKAAGQSRDTVSGLFKKISSWFNGQF
jgi:cell division protein FtsA